jgi:FkbM family methyltransferase
MKMIRKIKNYINAARQNFSSFRRKKRLSASMDKNKVMHLQPQVNCNCKWYGSSYGGFYIHPDELNERSIIYSFGIGKDISFDLSCIKKHGCKVYGFDPTPKSIDWISSQNLSGSFLFYNYGIAETTGELDFFLPMNKNGVSGSLVGTEVVNKDNSIKVKMKSFSAITAELGHTSIDVLKMDIEGSEYDVLESIIHSAVPVKQILVEFHDRLFDEKEEKSKAVVQKMNEAGYAIFAVSETFEEVSFIKK